jgi:type I restriction enzyme S subunit
MVDVITKHIDVWTSALMTKSTAGRGTNGKQTAYGIKKLRELILELAVRGLLVAQEPNDEPASVLLEKIAEEKARLVKVGKIKKQKPLPEVGEDEKPFILLNGWEWARFSDYYDVRDGTHDSPKSQPTGFPLVTSKNLSSGKLDLTNVYHISKEDHLKIIERSKVDKGDVLFAMIGSIGNPVIVDMDDEFSIKNVALFKYYLPEFSVPRYLQIFLELAAVELREKSLGGVQSFVSLGNLRNFVIAVPPLAEQHRIVAKVDELMALCDRLEEQQTDSNAAHQTLVEMLLATLTQSANQTEFAAAWQRIAEHFDTLFTTEHSIDQLKQTILQLAVMGKLVPQDPNDEPASVLLEKIAEEKARLVKAGELKKQDFLPLITDEEKEFESPKGWEFARLGNITNKIGSGSTPRGGESAYINSGIPFLRSQNIWNHGLEINDVAFISEETHKKMSNTVVISNDILLNITGASLGRCAVFPEDIGEANVSQHVTIIRPTISETKDYLHYCILSPYIQKLVWGRQVGMAREGLSKKVLELFEIPLPPLAEQHRIVAKVDELMTLCDPLKARIQSAQTTQIHLADTIVEQAVA